MNEQKSSPLVTVILPVYNAEQYLGQCLDSLIHQTYKNIEILCYNDGSSDRSIDLLNQYAKIDRRIVIFDRPNQGVAIVRNSGIEEAHGEYIMFSDADDWWELNAVERALLTMIYYDADVVLFSYFREYGHKTLKKTHIFSGDLVVFDERMSKVLWRSLAGTIGEELKYPENMDSMNALWNKIYKREIFIQNKEVRYIDNRKIGAGGDGLLNLMYFKYVRRAVYISDCLYHYRKTNENSIVTRYKPDFVDKRFYLFEQYGKYINENNLDNDFKLGLSNRVSLSIIGLGLHEISSDNPISIKIKNIRHILNDPRYYNRVRLLETKYMPVHWKLFFNACKHKNVCLVASLLLLIKYLKTVK